MAWAGNIPQNRIDKRTRRLAQQLNRYDLTLGAFLVPYTGAQDNVDLGSYTFTTTGVVATGDLTISSTLILASGSITDTTGTIDFDNEKIKTLGDFTSPKGTGAIIGNEAFGFNSLLNVTTGDYNTAIGSRALEGITIGHSNTALGRKAGVALTDGDYNVAIGMQALQAATTANQNVAIGKDALVALTTGSSNFACGYIAVNKLTEGLHNVGLGSEALNAITTHSYNTAIGSSALGAITASECVGIGYNAGKTCGTYSVSIGPFAGYVIGTNSVAVGSRAGFTTTLNNNVFIGHEAGRLNEGAGNVFLGYQAGRAETGSNKLYIQNSASVTPLILGDFSVPSLTINGVLTSGAHTINSTDSSDQVTISHDNSNAYMKWDDGALILQADEGDNADTNIEIHGKGTGSGKFRVYNQDDNGYVTFQPWGSSGFIQAGGTLTALKIQDPANIPITMFQDATEGKTQELLIYGYKTGDAKRSLQIGVGTDAADTASFDGVSNYYFDGNVGIETSTPDTELQVIGGCKFGDDNTNYASFAADGELTLTGTAKIKKRIMVPLAAIKTGAIDPPSEGTIDGFGTLDFDGGTKDEEVFKPFCGPLDWSAGTGATLNLRFFVDTAPATPANVVWQIEIKSIACDGIVDFSSGTSTYADIVAITTGTPANDKKLHCSELTIPAGDLIEGGCLFIRLHRDATHASDTFTGDARLLKVFITYTADKLGQAT